MNEQGTINKIKGKIAEICINQECGQGCSHCGSHGKAITMKAENDQNLDIKIGDKVEIYAPESQAILVGFMIFILPLILFIGFYYLANMIFSDAADYVPVLSGFTGIAIAFLINLVAGKLKKSSGYPKIVKIIQ
ncbi:MAG: SoxR reducing system RseC family protein [Spirochaetales bacterium]|nr:SoxR reducing system RseC family protein [Spirochaetales bacterium]